MPMKPHKDETQSEFMARCVPEEIGTGPDKRPQEQAVAICYGFWRDEHGGKPPSDKQVEVDPDEDYEDFMERCEDEEGLSENLCQMIWDERGAGKKLHNKTHAAKVNGMEFCLSDETPDRMGDILVASGWQLENFKKNPIALFGHRSDFVIGRWRDVRIDGQQLRGHLELAPKGTSPRIDEIRKLIEADILKAVSVGFREIESEPLDPKHPWGGSKYIKQELIETSLVSVPANPNALAIAKGLNISPDTLNLVFAKHGNQNTMHTRDGSAGKHAERHDDHRKGQAMSSLAQRIKTLEAHHVELRDQLEALVSKDDNDADEMKKIDELNAAIALCVSKLATLRETEKHVGESSQRSPEQQRQSIQLPARIEQQQPPTKAKPEYRPGGPRFKKTDDPLEMLIRAGTIFWIAKAQGRSPDEIRMRNYGDDPAQKVVCDWTGRASDEDEYMRWDQRAATAPAMTTVTTWAAELVQTNYGAFMPLLLAESIYPKLAARGLSMTFGRFGRVIIPTRNATPAISGSFVGEGQPIPVRQAAFAAITLVPKKMAVITTYTREISEQSIPAIEGLLREAIVEDTSFSLDGILLDNGAATAVRPAGLLLGATAITSSTDVGMAGMVADIKAVGAAVLEATLGVIRKPVWIMNPREANAVTWTMSPLGTFPFREEIGGGNLGGWGVIQSATVPVGKIVVVDAADFVSIDGDGPRFEVSDQATLHMENSAPLQINDGTPASPVRSLWQTDSIGLRMILPINWAMRRPGMVSTMATTNWHAQTPPSAG